MKKRCVREWARRLLAAGICTAVAAGTVPADLVHAEENQTEASQAESAPEVVADWKFSESGVESGTIAGGDLVIADQSGNDNDLRMQLYTGKQPTEDTSAADWTQYLSFSDDSMTGDGSMVFNGDSSNAGADFITVDDAAIIQKHLKTDIQWSLFIISPQTGPQQTPG